MGNFTGGYYLAHPTRSREKILDWEKIVEEKCGVVLFNPFYDGCPEDMKLIDSGVMTDWDFDADKTVRFDIDCVRKSDGLVAVIDENPTYGTVMEIVYAKLAGKKSYLICTNGKENHPWLRYHSDRVFTSLEEAYDFFHSGDHKNNNAVLGLFGESKAMKELSKLDIKNGSYYLAHPLLARKEVREWQKEFEKKTGIPLINPFYDVPRRDIEIFDSGKELSPSEKRSPTDVVEGDLHLIKHASRGLVAVIDKSQTYGTIQEIAYAKAAFCKEVHLIVLNGCERHLFLRHHADSIFTSFEKFEDFAQSILT